MTFPRQTNNTADPVTFEDQYPDAEPGHSTEDGMTRAFSEYKCDVCGRPTPWFHYTIAVYLCSGDCLTQYRSSE